MLKQSCYILLSVLLSFSLFDFSMKAQDPLILFDFEDPGSISGWNISGGGISTKLSTEWSSSGSYSLQMNFPANGPSTYMIAEIPGSILPITDFSLKDQLSIDIYNPTSELGILKVELRTTDGGRKRIFFEPDTNSSNTFIYPLIDDPDFSYDKISKILIYNSGINREFKLFIDNISLSTSEAARKREYQKRLDVFIENYSYLDQTIKNIGGDLELVWDDAEEIQKRLNDNLQLAGLDSIEERILKLEAIPKLIDFYNSENNIIFKEAFSSERIHIYAKRLDDDLPNLENLSLKLAKGEYESRQIVIVPTINNLENVSWSLSPLKNSNGENLDARIRVLGYVKCEETPYFADYRGWLPDPLIENVVTISEVPVGETLVLWITLFAEESTPTGLYTGNIEISSGQNLNQTIPVEAEVWNFTLPKTSSIPTITTVQHNVRYIESMYPANPGIVKDYEEYALKYRLSPTHLYQVAAKYSDSRIQDLIEKGQSCFVLGQIGNRTLTESNIDSYHNSYIPNLEIWNEKYNQIRANGFEGPVVITAYDEVPGSMTSLIEATRNFVYNYLSEGAIYLPVGSLDPDLGYSWNPTASDWVIHLNKFYSEYPSISSFSSRGGNPWFYTAIAPHPNPMFYVEYGGLDARVLGGVIPWKYKVNGWLYYHLCRWPVNNRPLRTIDGRRTDWNPKSYNEYNGSGSLIYAGDKGPIATIRLENLRDGLEDYEYYTKTYEIDELESRVPPNIYTDITKWSRESTDYEEERLRLAEIINTTTNSKSNINLEPSIIFPNPGTGEFYLKTNSILSNYKIVNLLGQNIENGIISENITKINLISQKPGIYLCIIDDKDKPEIKKIILYKN